MIITCGLYVEPCQIVGETTSNQATTLLSGFPLTIVDCLDTQVMSLLLRSGGVMAHNDLELESIPSTLENRAAYRPPSLLYACGLLERVPKMKTKNTHQQLE